MKKGGAPVLSGRVGNGKITKPKQRQQKQQQQPIVDARNKIIQKNRLKIRDARDKLHQINKVTDARLKIMKKRGSGGPPQAIPPHQKLSPHHQHPQQRRRPHHGPPPLPPQPSSKQQQRGGGGSAFGWPPQTMRKFNDFDAMDIEEDDGVHFTLRRTVKNDVVVLPKSIPPFPHFSSGSGGSGGRQTSTKRDSPTSFWSSDPFDVYEVPVRRFDVPEILPQRKIYNHSPQPMESVGGGSGGGMPRKGILRNSRLMPLSPPQQSKQQSIHSHHNRYTPEESSLSFEMRARLERTPDIHESSGIFARGGPPVQPKLIQSNGFRIVVSNLHSSVSQSDIKVSGLYFNPEDRKL